MGRELVLVYQLCVRHSNHVGLCSRQHSLHEQNGRSFDAYHVITYSDLLE